jgi:hypothetical protein
MAVTAAVATAVVGALSVGAQTYASSEQMAQQKRMAAQQSKEKAMALANVPALNQPAPMAAQAGTTPLLGTNVSPLLGMPQPDLKESPAQGLAAAQPEEDPLKKQQQGGMTIGT